MSVPWIKLTTNIFDDDKIKLIDSMPEHDAILVIWIKLLTLAGRSNAGGCLMVSESMPYTEEMLAAIFNRPGQVVRLALEAFEKLGMIERHNSIMLVNWEKHQNSAALDTIREHEKTRKRLQRNKIKQIPENTCPGNVPDNVPEMSQNVRILDIEEDIDKEECKSADKPPPLKRFIKPTLEEVREYCKERGNAIDAQAFIDYYEATNWMRNKTKITSWKSCVHTWEKKDYNKKTPEPIYYYKAKECPICHKVDMWDNVCRNRECPQYSDPEYQRGED